jgi:pimeloyl-ACP methyl ester carboxylesterase
MVHGSLAVAEAWSAVANLLADSFTCYLMDRRARGRSGDAPDYSIEREYQDIAAVLRAAGPRPHLIGHSYGAVCALGAALETPVDKLILYEPPAGAVFGPELEEYRQAIAAGDTESALEIGITKVVGVPQSQFEAMRADPIFSMFKALAPGWVREMEAIERLGTSLERYRPIQSSVLMLLGTDTSDSLKNSTAALTRVLKNARIAELSGQGHVALRTAPSLVAERVREFLT